MIAQENKKIVPIFFLRIIQCILVPFILIASNPIHATQPVDIGILAKRGNKITLNRWLPLAGYLNKNIPEYSFSIKPIAFHEVSDAVAHQKVDFLFANPGIYVEMEVNYGVRPIATVRTRRGVQGTSFFAGLIITREDRDDIVSFQDLRGKSFMAVDRDSLGGWLMAKRELELNGINTDRDFKAFSFVGTHDDVVNAVLNREVDAGTVRSDTLEHMSKGHLVDITKLRVMHGGDRKHFNFDIGEDDFPYPHSTDIYPEWPMFKLQETPDELANKVAIALLQMSSKEDVARQCDIMGWNVARNYQPVHDLYRELRIGPYRVIDHLQLHDVWQRYWTTITAVAVFLSILCIMLFTLVHLRMRLLKANHKITHLAMHDPLTNLPNRRMFGVLAENAFAQARREGWKVYLLLIDLDGFKAVNDTFGHESGDEVLRQISQRLRNALPCQDHVKPLNSFPSLKKNRQFGSLLRTEDPIARHGGDEFLSMLIHVKEVEDVGSIARRITDSIQVPINISGQKVSVGASIGISIFPDDDVNLQKLIKKADDAMYEAKQAGKGTFRLYNQSLKKYTKYHGGRANKLQTG
ncbi:MAG: PhnD/SsuA/transferrin family substrate-binding protein [Desulforhopalus sp.]